MPSNGAGGAELKSMNKCETNLFSSIPLDEEIKLIQCGTF